MTQQTWLPSQWVIVDDGSTDGTTEVLQSAAQDHRWITVVRRSDRGFRKSGGGVVEALYDGYAALTAAHWDFLVKLDGDLCFEADYFESCLSYFAHHARLGMGGGTVYVEEQGNWKVDSPSDPPFHVRGATKIYRRDCWNQIQPLPSEPGWDTVDEVRANMNGWTTSTFRAVRLLQQKPTGSADGEWANSFKNGVANYVAGYHPAFMLAKCIRRGLRGSLVAPTALLAGFCAGYLRKRPQFRDVNAVRYLRQQQIRRLLWRPSIYANRHD